MASFFRRALDRIISFFSSVPKKPAPLPAMARSCCDEDSCIRKDIANLLDPDSPIENRVYVAASAVARTCGSLTAGELSVCASRLFDSPSDCDLTKAFVIAYQTERDALAGQRDIKLRAAGGE